MPLKETPLKPHGLLQIFYCAGGETNAIETFNRWKPGCIYKVTASRDFFKMWRKYEPG
jgi:hypothetical protein